MSDPKSSRDGDLYDSGMGNLGPGGITGGSVEFNKDKPGIDHHVVHGDGGHFSWDKDYTKDPKGDVSRDHGWLHDPKRPW